MSTPRSTKAKPKPKPKKSTTKKKKFTGRYPKGVVVKSSECDLNKLKKLYGGKLPDIKGKKRKYPSRDDEDGWRVVYAAALTYKNKDRFCRTRGYEPPACAHKSKYEYLLFHGRPDKKKDRAARNRDRKIHGLKKGDKRVIHHLDPNDMSTKKTVMLTHCQHQRMHGKVCQEEQ